MSDSGAQPLHVVFCWHMHQPDYRGPDHADYQLPWVYLHGLKDYVDMVAHLEYQPKARAVVNFAPVLLEQLEDYAEQVGQWLERGLKIGDPLLAALAGPELPSDPMARWGLVQACLRANERRLISRFKHLRELVDLANFIEERGVEPMGAYLNDQFLIDLLMWYHIAWTGECVRVNDARVQALQRKGCGFDTYDRRQMIEVIHEQLSGLLGRYRALAEAGRIELSVTPYAHPIVPLMLDLDSAREAMPEIALPQHDRYPHGEERARWHIRESLDVFERHFGHRPAGCWPSEGAVSEAALKLFEDEGFKWVASGQQVLYNSLAAVGRGHGMPSNWLHTPYRFQGGTLGCFFRDDGLSDLIGFTYADWHADDAVGDLVRHLENIANANAGKPETLVSIIMDGENAWEYYPHNGAFFLEALYRRLVEHPRINLTTFSEYLSQRKEQPPSLTRLVAGSWVYGTFSTWIGDPDKNRAWDMLIEAKHCFDRVVASGQLDADALREAEIQLATCEGSDWFWWFGDYNPGDTVSDFERLYRRQLGQLYDLLGEPRPDYLGQVFARGSGRPTLGGVMKKN